MIIINIYTYLDMNDVFFITVNQRVNVRKWLVKYVLKNNFLSMKVNSTSPCMKETIVK